ncbi:hypothetical protein E1295_45625 [Nonomuraea mesophila]|uniref:Uncharacterized protein n=1 Tax=Nonomuraea mesophila TaxID=2530382 RepID=A0A4R5E4M7_9ACTN|nr:hypothetical protein [Nonomuraea mesophila]TDE23962.1 hypothetical protein E1295_45625 [Nonomuraea mesophila]
MSGEQRTFELTVPQIMGSALAAVTAAVAASYLGVAGTVIGAAVVSVASTIAGAVYTHYLARTSDRVKQRALVVRKAETSGDGTVKEEPAGKADKEEEKGPAPVVPAAEPAWRLLPWTRLGAAAVVVFALSMGGILIYQAVAQRTVHEQVTGKQPKGADERSAPVGEKKKEEERPTRKPEYVRGMVTRDPTTPEPTKTPGRTPSQRPAPTKTVTVSPSRPPSSSSATPPPVVDDQPGEEMPSEESQLTDPPALDDRPGHPERPDSTDQADRPTGYPSTTSR